MSFSIFHLSTQLIMSFSHGRAQINPDDYTFPLDEPYRGVTVTIRNPLE
jgi:hypothetical protein